MLFKTSGVGVKCMKIVFVPFLVHVSQSLHDVHTTPSPLFCALCNFANDDEEVPRDQWRRKWRPAKFSKEKKPLKSPRKWGRKQQETGVTEDRPPLAAQGLPRDGRKFQLKFSVHFDYSVACCCCAVTARRVAKKDSSRTSRTICNTPEHRGISGSEDHTSHN